MSDPVSWLQIGQGWSVVASDGVVVGTVAQVEGDKGADIFNGLAVEPSQSSQLRYLPSEQVAAIHPGEVSLTIASAGVEALEPFEETPPVTTWRPGRPPLSKRISAWLRGRR
jgi:hypothetical protein